MQCDIVMFADSANFSQEGKLNFLGEFNVLRTSGPMAMTPGKLVARITASQAEIGTHTLSLRVVTADGDLLITSPTSPMILTKGPHEGIPVRTWVVADLPPVPLPAPGIYSFELYVDNQRLEVVGEMHVLRQK